MLQPPFYEVLRGEPWLPPGYEPPVQPAMDERPFDPPDRPLTREERQLIQQHQRERERMERERMQPTRPTRPNTRPGRQPDGIFSPRVETHVQLAQARPTRPTPMPPPEWMMEQEMYRSERPFRPGMQQPMPHQPGQPLSELPQGRFRPGDFRELVVIAHDDTVEPSKVYRYRLRYKLRNPVHNTNAGPEEVVEVFALQSPESDWTPPVSVPGRVHFFFTRSGLRDVVGFEVFKWHEGIWHAEQFAVSSGDLVGQPRQEVDFATGWTLVDMRSEGTALLADDNGNMQRRTVRSDTSDPRLAELRDLVRRGMDEQQAGAGVALPWGGR
jgi:hypothetical protein